MKKISAKFVFPISSAPIEGGVVVMDDTGLVLDVLNNTNGLSDIEFYDGVLCPGFVNTHCHLELSHLKAKIPTGTGMTGFIKEIINNKGIEKGLVQEGLKNGEQELLNNGVVAVGDICNTADTFEMKTKKRLHYHSFLEVFSIVPQQAGEVFSRAKALHKQAMKLGLSASLSPHAPYTCSIELMQLINNFPGNNGQPFTIHNQESMHEDEFFRSGEGALFNFYKELDVELSFFHATGKSSLEWLLPQLPIQQNILLVHNTFTQQKEMDIALANNPNLYWCLCPKANLYIQNETPDDILFSSMVDNVTIGTDSLASNDTLSVLEELKILQEVMPNLSMNMLLQWGTLNGARYMGMESEIGTLEKGKRPGLNLIMGAGIDRLQLSKDLSVRPLY